MLAFAYQFASRGMDQSSNMDAVARKEGSLLKENICNLERLDTLMTWPGNTRAGSMRAQRKMAHSKESYSPKDHFFKKTS